MDISGIVIVVLTVSNLVGYHQSSKKYIEQVYPLVDRLSQGNMTPEDQEYHLQLQELFASKLSKEEFSQHIGIINRALQPNPAPIRMEERIDLFHDLQFLRLQMERKSFPEHPSYWIYLGLGLCVASSYLKKKLKPSPETPAPPAQLWNDVPAPILTKSGSLNDTSEKT